MANIPSNTLSTLAPIGEITSDISFPSIQIPYFQNSPTESREELLSVLNDNSPSLIDRLTTLIDQTDSSYVKPININFDTPLVSSAPSSLFSALMVNSPNIFTKDATTKKLETAQDQITFPLSMLDIGDIHKVKNKPPKLSETLANFTNKGNAAEHFAPNEKIMKPVDNVLKTPSIESTKTVVKNVKRPLETVKGKPVNQL
jgi:hypothetical protein